MLYELVADPGGFEPAEFESALLDELSQLVAEAGVDTVVDVSGVDAAVIETLAAGGTPDLSLSAAAAILAVDDDYPDAETIERETLDDILLGMTMGVLDVDAVAANIELDISPKGVQQRIEGRTELSISEYAHIKQFVASQQR